jgi:hypothetical protein
MTIRPRSQRIKSAYGSVSAGYSTSTTRTLGAPALTHYKVGDKDMNELKAPRDHAGTRVAVRALAN